MRKTKKKLEIRRNRIFSEEFKKRRVQELVEKHRPSREPHRSSYSKRSSKATIAGDGIIPLLQERIPIAIAERVR
ncbi:MAG: hypothetical protein WD824_03090 [Cyclobacteriaceae bacterium]